MRNSSWLSTLCKASCWLPLCLCFLSFSAEAVEAPWGVFVSPDNGPFGPFPTVTAACSYEEVLNYYSPPATFEGTELYSATPTLVHPLVGGVRYTVLSGQTEKCLLKQGSVTYDHAFVYSGPYCEQGKGPSGGHCTECPPGTTDIGGVCQEPLPECPSAGSSVGHPLITGDITGSASIAGTGVCISNPNAPGTPGAVCGAQCSSGAVSADPVTGMSQMYCQSASFTGGSCSGGSVAAADPGPDPDFGEAKEPEGGCPPGTVSGQINDLDVCLPSGSTVDAEVKKVSQGDKTLTTNKVQTVNSDGTVTTEFVNTFDDGNTKTVSTTVTNDGIGIGNDAGSNGGKDGSEDMPIPDMDTSLGGFEMLPTRVPDNPVFSTSIISTSASCPPPITFTVMDIDLSIDFEPICDLAPMIRAIMLILAGMVALRVVVSK